MYSEKIRFSVVMSVLIMFLPCAASANMVWPSLYIVSGMMSWYIIFAGLIIEVLFIKFILKPSWIRAVAMSVGMNVASALIGYIAIPASGILLEVAMIPFGSGTFALSHWIGDYILAVLCNVLIEGLFLKLVFKLGFKKNFKWLLIANAISVIISVFVLVFNRNGMGI